VYELGRLKDLESENAKLKRPLVRCWIKGFSGIKFCRLPRGGKLSLISRPILG